MKKYFIFVLLLVSTQAFAFGFFTLNPSISVFPGRISAQVFNPYYEPIFCQGFAYGRTASNFVYHAAFRDIIPAGQYRYALVYTNRFNPFIQGWANIQCRFLR